MITPLYGSLGPLKLGGKAPAFDPLSTSPYHYLDADILAGLYQEQGGDPVSAVGQQVNYIDQGATEPLYGANGGFQLIDASTLGAFTGYALSAGGGGNRSLHGSTEYGGDECFIALVYGVGWGGGLKGIVGKVANKGQVFFNGDTNEVSVFNENGSFVATGLSINGGFYKLVVQHITSGSVTKVSLDGGATYVTITTAGNNWYGLAEFGNSGGAGFGGWANGKYKKAGYYRRIPSSTELTNVFTSWTGS